MRAHFLQHVPFEGLGSIALWLEAHGYTISSTQFFQSAQLPKAEAIDLLIVMGGPMSVNDENAYPWLAAEKLFIKNLIDAGVPTLGICLGAQLIANAMGARVYANKVKEIGWFPVQAVSTADNCFSFPDKADVFHWHGETFELPAQAVLLAESEGCRNQAFQLGTHVLALQFHLETTQASAEDIVAHCRDELIAGKYIQSEDKILSVPQIQYDTANELMYRILSYLSR